MHRYVHRLYETFVPYLGVRIATMHSRSTRESDRDSALSLKVLKQEKPTTFPLVIAITERILNMTSETESSSVATVLRLRLKEMTKQKEEHMVSEFRFDRLGHRRGHAPAPTAAMLLVTTYIFVDKACCWVVPERYHLTLYLVFPQPCTESNQGSRRGAAEAVCQVSEKASWF